MTDFEQQKPSEAKSKIHRSYTQTNPSVCSISQKEQKLPFFPLNLLTKLGPIALVRCARIRYLMKFIPAPEKFLDIGCGSGTVSFFLAHLGLKGMAIDFSEEAVSKTKQLLASFPSIDVLQTDLDSIKEKDKFDMVVLWEVLEHIENDEATLKSIHEKLRDDGHLLLSVPCRRSQWSIWDEFAGHLRRYEAKELHDLLSRTGYEVVSLLNSLTAWYFTMLPIGKLIAFRNRKGWEHKTTTEMTKKSGVRLLMLSPILARPLKVILNIMLLPFFLVLEATFAHNLSYGGYSYQVLARKLR